MKIDPSKNIPTQASLGSDWLQWYINLRSNFSKNVANTEFLKAWHLRGTDTANTSELRAYLSKNGIDIEKGILSTLLDEGESVVGKIGSMLSVGKYAVYAVGGIVILGLGMSIFNIAKNPAKASGVAAKSMI